MNKKFIFHLHILPKEFAAYYRGEKTAVIAKASNGRRIRFPAIILRKFITHDGIKGTFVMEVDQNSRFLSMKRIE